MKKNILFLIFALCILVMAGGCSKKGTTKVGEPTSKIKKDTANKVTTAAEANTDKKNGSNSEPVELKKEEYNIDDYIKLGQYKGVQVTASKAKVTDEEINKQIHKDLVEKATEVTGRKAKKGDVVNIDFEGLKDGVAFDGGTAKGTDLEIGSNSFIDGFEEGLIGAKKGEERKLNLTFPESYGEKTLAGQKVVFNVKVNAIKEVPKLTEDYVKKNTDYASVAAYKKSVKKKLQTEKDKNNNNNKQNEVITAIMQNSEMKSIPETLITYYEGEFKNMAISYANYNGMSYNEYLEKNKTTEEDFNSQAKSYAEERSKVELVLKAIVKAEGMKISDDEYQKGLAEMVKNYGLSSSDDLLKVMKEDEIKENLLLQKALDFVVEKAVEK